MSEQSELDSSLRSWAGEGDVEKLGNLLQQGADPNARNEGGNSAFILAVGARWRDDGHRARIVESIKILHEAGANLEQADRDGFTPLTVAAYMGNCPVATYLLEHGANLLHRCRQGKTPTDWARERQHADLLQLIESFSSEAGPVEASRWSNRAEPDGEP
jgi:ankyrin repeat protein